MIQKTRSLSFRFVFQRVGAVVLTHLDEAFTRLTFVVLGGTQGSVFDNFHIFHACCCVRIPACRCWRISTKLTYAFTFLVALGGTAVTRVFSWSWEDVNVFTHVVTIRWYSSSIQRFFHRGLCGSFFFFFRVLDACR